MLFQTVKTAIVNTLQAQAAGRFNIIGYEPQSHDAQAMSELNRHVTVYYKSGSFPREGTSYTEYRHDMTFEISFLVAGGGGITLPPAGSGAGAFMSALAQSMVSADHADKLWDDLLSTVWNILADPRNADLGLPPGTIGSMFLDSPNKDAPQDRGEYTVISGSLQLTCTGMEVATGETGIEGLSIDATIPPGLDMSAAPGGNTEGVATTGG